MAPAPSLLRGMLIAAAVAIAAVAVAAAPAAAASAAATAAPTASAAPLVPACACAPPPPLVDSVAAAPHTLVAKVTHVLRSPVPVEGDPDEDVYMATVGTAFVGCTLRRIMLSTPAATTTAADGGCATTLTIGKVYLLILPAADANGTYRVPRCGPQREWTAVGAADRHMLWRVNGMVCPRPKRVVLGRKR